MSESANQASPKPVPPSATAPPILGPITVGELAALIGADIGVDVVGDADRTIAGCATLEDAGPQDVSFLANPKYQNQLAKTKAGAVIVGRADAALLETIPNVAVLAMDDPYFGFRNAIIAMYGHRVHPAISIGEQDGDGNKANISDRANVSGHASVAESATLGEGCVIHPFACIAVGVTIGARTVVYPHCYVGKDASVGEDCILYPNVTVYDRCVLGDRVTLHAGTVIGQDGFGYATHRLEGDVARHHKIPQVGNVIVGDDVEMGANCSVDRATLGSTRIEQGTKFSNSVTIGHGTRVGKHSLYVAQVGVAGSVKAGDYVVLGGQVGVAGHLSIATGTQVAAQSGVISSLKSAGQKYGGHMAFPLNQFLRSTAVSRKLPDMAKQLNDAQTRIEALEAKLDAVLSGITNAKAGNDTTDA